MAFRDTAAGTRPGLRSQTLISTGQADLDRILGGGLPLGTVLLLLEDPLTTLHNTVLKYFVAEGVACGQSVHWATIAGFGTEGSLKLPQVVQSSTQAAEEPAATEEETGAGLKIAWQYRRYIEDKQKPPPPPPRKAAGSSFQRKRGNSSPAAAAAKDWCHTFDLSRPSKATESELPHLEQQKYSGSGAVSSLLEAAQKLKVKISNSSDTVINPPAQPVRSLEPRVVGTLPDPTEAPAAKPAGRPVRRLMSSMSRDKDDGLGKSSQLTSQQGSEGAATDLASMTLSSASPSQLRVDASDEPGHSITLSAEARQASPSASCSVPGTPKQVSGGDVGQVGRLAIQSLGSYQWGVSVGEESAAGHLLSTVHQLKRIARSCRMAVMLSIPAELYESGFASRLQHLCDAVMLLEAVNEASDIARIIPDPKSCYGTLRILKLPGANTIAPPTPVPDLYLLRHKRRRISLEPFEVDPDAEAGDTGGAPLTAPPLACGVGTSSSKLDF